MEKYLIKMCKLASKYAKNKADKVYIYCTRRKEMYSAISFFQRNDKVVLAHNLNETLTLKDKYKFLKFDVSDRNQEKTLDLMIDIFMELCKENDKVRELKIVYEVKSKKLDYIVSEKEIPFKVSDYDSFMKWYNEVKEQVENK